MLKSLIYFLFSTIFLLLGLFGLIYSIPMGICWIGVSAFLNSSIREKFYSITHIELNRKARAGLIFVLCMSSCGFGISESNRLIKEQELAKKKEIELAELRDTDPKAYLEEIKQSKDQTLYLSEWEKLDPTSFQTEVKLQEERKQLEIEQQNIASQKAIEEQKIANQKELIELKSLLSQKKPDAIEDKIQIYNRLVVLDPSNVQYKKEKDKLDSQVQQQEKKENDLKLAISNPEQFLEIVKFSWNKQGFGVVMEANFTIKNTASIDLKDFKIRCEHSAASGTLIDSNNHTIYDVVKANSTKNFRAVNMGFINSQAARSSCTVVSASS